MVCTVSSSIDCKIDKNMTCTLSVISDSIIRLLPWLIFVSVLDYRRNHGTTKIRINHEKIKMKIN